MKDLRFCGGLSRRLSSLGDMTLECVGETRRLLFQARQANRPMCGQKGLWLSAAASVSFGLSTLAAKCPKRVRLDKGGKVRGWRWQDFRDQSWRDVPEFSVLPLKRLGKPARPSSSLRSPPPRVMVKTPSFLGRLCLHLKVEQSEVLKLGCWIRGFRLLKRSYPPILPFVLFFTSKSNTENRERKHL